MAASSMDARPYSAFTTQALGRMSAWSWPFGRRRFGALAPARPRPHFPANGSRQRFMTDSEPQRTGFSVDVKPHAYDPVRNPELFEGVLARRLLAFCIDVVIISIPVML